MTINQFAREICRIEGKKKQINIAQVKEILKVANRLLGGYVYRLIRAS